MRKYLSLSVTFSILSLLISSLSFLNITATLAHSEQLKGGAFTQTGWFEHNFYDNEAVLWLDPPNSPDGRSGIGIGKITPSTKIHVVNQRGVTHENIKLFNGKRVSVVTKYHSYGKGEGVKNYCEELTVMVLDY